MIISPAYIMYSDHTRSSTLSFHTCTIPRYILRLLFYLSVCLCEFMDTCVCWHMHLCAHVKIRRWCWVAFCITVKLVLLRQCLSLNMRLMFSPLRWRLANPTHLFFPTFELELTGVCYLLWGCCSTLNGQIISLVPQIYLKWSRLPSVI